MAESLESGRVNRRDKQGEYFSLIVGECRRLAALVQNVLDFSRIEEGRREYDFRPENIADLVREAVRAMSPCAAERRVTIHLNEEQIPFEPRVDRLAIQQILVNLLDNAIKHSPPGAQVEVRVGATVEHSIVI